MTNLSDRYFTLFFPRKCDYCRKWNKTFVNHYEDEVKYRLCKSCHLVIICSPFFGNCPKIR